MLQPRPPAPPSRSANAQLTPPKPPPSSAAPVSPLPPLHALRTSHCAQGPILSPDQHRRRACAPLGTDTTMSIESIACLLLTHRSPTGANLPKAIPASSSPCFTRLRRRIRCLPEAGSLARVSRVNLSPVTRSSIAWVSPRGRCRRRRALSPSRSARAADRPPPSVARKSQSMAPPPHT